MGKIDDYRQHLRTLDDWDAYLMEHSGLPGPRGNLELLHAVMAEGDEARFARYRALTPEAAPTNSPAGFLAMCGVAGLSKRLAAGDWQAFDLLRQYANDPRWRIREAVCIALQSFGVADPGALLDAVEGWQAGSLLERRALAAALCEPALLARKDATRRTLAVLAAITATLPDEPDSRADDFKVLRQALGYCWSVAVAALPDEGMPLFERWLASDHPAIRWIMRENLKKARLARMDAAWVDRCQAALDAAG